MSLRMCILNFSQNVFSEGAEFSDGEKMQKQKSGSARGTAAEAHAKRDGAKEAEVEVEAAAAPVAEQFHKNVVRMVLVSGGESRWPNRSGSSLGAPWSTVTCSRRCCLWPLRASVSQDALVLASAMALPQLRPPST